MELHVWEPLHEGQDPCAKWYCRVTVWLFRLASVLSPEKALRWEAVSPPEVHGVFSALGALSGCQGKLEPCLWLPFSFYKGDLTPQHLRPLVGPEDM